MIFKSIFDIKSDEVGHAAFLLRFLSFEKKPTITFKSTEIFSCKKGNDWFVYVALHETK